MNNILGPFGMNVYSNFIRPDLISRKLFISLSISLSYKINDVLNENMIIDVVLCVSAQLIELLHLVYICMNMCVFVRITIMHLMSWFQFQIHRVSWIGSKFNESRTFIVYTNRIKYILLFYFTREVNCNIFFLLSILNSTDKWFNKWVAKCSTHFFFSLIFILFYQVIYFIFKRTTINFQWTLHTNTLNTRAHYNFIFISILLIRTEQTHKPIKQCVIACYSKNEYVTNGNRVIFLTFSLPLVIFLSLVR